MARGFGLMRAWPGILVCAAMLSLFATGCGVAEAPARDDRVTTSPLAEVPASVPPASPTPEPPPVAPPEEGVEPILLGVAGDPTDAVAEPPAVLEICRGTPTARQAERGRGRDVDLVGRVVTPSGEGVRNARVTLVGLAVPALEQRPRFGTRALIEARTDDEGCFAIVGAGDGTWDDLYLRIEARGMLRTFDLQRIQDRGLRIRLAPSRPVRVIVECAAEETAGGSVTGYWHASEGEDVFAARWLHTAGVPAPEDPLRPGFDRALSPEGDATIVEGATARVDIRLPIGTSTLVVQGECGLGFRQVDVAPGRGRLRPIRIRVPHPDSASISVRLREPPAANTWADRELLTLRFGDFYTRSLPLRRDGEMATIDGLPPGEYQLGNPRRPGCFSTVELAPGEHRTMVLDNQDCRVWRWRRPDYH